MRRKVLAFGCAEKKRKEEKRKEFEMTRIECESQQKVEVTKLFDQVQKRRQDI